jgi:hypothetical protein
MALMVPLPKKSKPQGIAPVDQEDYRKHIGRAMLLTDAMLIIQDIFADEIVNSTFKVIGLTAIRDRCQEWIDELNRQAKGE